MIVAIWNKIKKRFFPSEFDKAIQRWFRDKGDQTLRLNYDLNEHSVVFDLGGYEGQWSADIFQRYQCNVYIFEPVKAYHDRIAQRFSGNPLIRPFQFGLADVSKECKIGIAQDGSSVYIDDTQFEIIQLVSVNEFLENHSIEKIDLMKINIEGGEYDLLEQVLSSGIIEKIQNIQIQFHDIAEIPNVLERMHMIQHRLTETHTLTFQYYPFVWENWRKK